MAVGVRGSPRGGVGIIGERLAVDPTDVSFPLIQAVSSK